MKGIKSSQIHRRREQSDGLPGSEGEAWLY